MTLEQFSGSKEGPALKASGLLIAVLSWVKKI